MVLFFNRGLKPARPLLDCDHLIDDGRNEGRNAKEKIAMWSEGKIDGYDFCVKHFEEGSIFGIDEGRISKLNIRKDGIDLCDYDRGWDVEPVAEVMPVYEKLLKKFN